MCEFQELEQEYYSTTAEAFYKIGHISTRLVNLLA